MSANSEQLQQYFERIHFDGVAKPDIQTLFDLHRQHTFVIPFENLAIFEGQDILVDPDSLFDKIVQRGRGGYCFEMNGLLAFILRRIGFDVRDLLARVFVSENEVFAKLHHILLVEVEGKRFLCDVGFGGNGLIEPIELAMDKPVTQFGETYRLMHSDAFGYILQHQLDGAFTNQYAFTLEACKPVVDYLAPNFFCSKFPESLFTNQLMCTRPTPDGRVTISGKTLKIRTGGRTDRQEVSDPESFNRMVRDHFDLEIDSLTFKNAKGEHIFPS